MRFQTVFTERDTEYYKDWLGFYPKKDNGFRFTLEPWWYFDPRPMIVTNVTSLLLLIGIFITGFSWFSLLWLPLLFFGWGQIFLRLPFNSGKGDESHGPTYGIMAYGHSNKVDEFWIRLGNKSKHIYMPWDFKWYRTSILLKDGSWEHEFRGDKKEFYNDEWKEKQYCIEYDYADKYDNTIVPTKVYVDEREWRRRIFMRIPLFNLVRTSIDVHFFKEVGKQKGSWKGGTIGCGYNLKKGETALECIRRMERERDL